MFAFEESIRILNSKVFDYEFSSEYDDVGN